MHSARIAKFGDRNYYEVERLKTAAKLLRGKLNHSEPTHSDDRSTYSDYVSKGGDNLWAVEIALAHTDTLKHQATAIPKVGERWRINFSRVEKKGEINWTW